jgi:hypothetical protein
MAIKKDLNILGKKVTTTSSKKDISVVTDINSYVQKIENVLKTQKGELPADLGIGSNYYNYKYSLPNYSGFLESDIRNDISYAIMDLISVNPKLYYFDTEKMIFQISFQVLDSANKNTNSCTIEVSLL